MKYTKDDKTLPELANKVIQKYRPDLREVKFLFCWRDNAKYSDNLRILADVAKLSDRDRDLYGFDVRMTVDLEAFHLLNKAEKEKLMFHELEHVRVQLIPDVAEREEDPQDKRYEVGEAEEKGETSKTAEEILEELMTPDIVDGEPMYDNEGRIKIYMMGHDLDIRRFKSEMHLYGLSVEEEGMRRYLNYIHDNIGLTQDILRKQSEPKKKKKVKKYKS